jgi:hypothetical protein
MKFYISLILASILLFAGCASKEVVKEKEVPKTVEKNVAPPKKILSFDMKEREYVRKNHIMVIDKLRFDYDKNNTLIPNGKVSTTTYDQNGFLTNTTIYGKNESVRDIYSYKYDPYGTRIETDRSDPNGVPSEKFTYEYDRRGNKIKSVRYDLNNKMENYYLYKYDARGNLIEDQWYDASGKLEYKIVNKYDEEGNKTESRSYGDDGSFLAHFTYRYDANGNIVEEAQFDNRDKPVGIIQYVYQYY